MSTKLTPAVAYIRMSSGKQEASPDQQRAEVRKLAKRHKCKILREYFDEAISGDATEKRTAFKQMIADAEEKGDFCAILCWDMDRFGRFDSIEAGRWIYPLRKAGVWLITVGQGQIDWNDFAGRMMYSIQQEGKHQFLVDLSRNVLRGRIASAKSGNMVVRPPYGYDRIFHDAEGKLVRRVPHSEKFNRPSGWFVRLSPAKDATEVEVVRWLFGRFADQDCSMRSLVLDLNRRGIKTRRGGKWNAVSVRYILTNPAYVGRLAFGRRRGGKYHQVGPSGELVKSNGDACQVPPIVAKDAHEPLVELEAFDRVQRKLLERGEKGSRPRRNGYVLTGVVRCGHCGRPMCGKPGGGRGPAKHRYYYCPGNSNGECRSYSVRQDLLDAHVFDVIHTRLFAPRALEAIKKAIHRRAKGQRGFQASIKAMQTQIAALDRKIEKGRENLLLADSDDIPDLSRLLAEWKQERSRLGDELESTVANASGKTAEERAARAIAELKNLRKHFQSADPLKVRAVVKAMVEEIRLCWEPAGKRYHQVANGVLTLRANVGVLKSISSIAFDLPRSETAAPSRPPAK
jgi:site-specific DNA recombinase